MQRLRGATLGVALGLFAPLVSAIGVVAASPQGEVAQVRQVSVRFSAAVVAFGDPRLADPFEIACRGTAPPGSGRWVSDRAWVYDFREALPPGTRCTASLREAWRPAATAAGGEAAAAAVTGKTRFAFSTGGPAVLSIQPYPASEVEEDPHFLIRLNGPAVEATVPSGAWCEVEGIGERLPLRLVDGALRERVLAARRVKPADAPRVLVARCERPLPNGAGMRLVWGKGIAARADPKVATTLEQRFDYRVRAPFAAEFSCERERAEAACLPIRPLRLRFSAPIARALADAVRLVPEGGAGRAPVFDKDDKAVEVTDLVFATPLAENAAFRIELPPGLQDNAGRSLANAASFPLRVTTAIAPPIAKFAAAPFGVVERHAEAALPVTLRHVQGDLRPAATGGQVRLRRLLSDADIFAWYVRLQAHHETQMTARELGRPPGEWFTFEDDTDARGRPVKRRVERRIGTRELSLLNGDAAATRLELPQLQGGDPRPFEVVGIPLPEAGYHVVELESLRLGQSLLDKREPMYVRTGVLVTDLGVHFKLGRENSVVWVTSLARGQPVANADVAVADCRGKPLWSGKTDAHGLAIVARALAPDPGRCPADSGYFVTARQSDREGRLTDVAFVFSSWQKGIESWRFDVPTGGGSEPDLRAATVFDRTLLRAGETVSMKHFVRLETSGGLAPVPTDRLPTRAKIVHQGSGQEFAFPLQWAAGGRSALTSWSIPAAARLGVYDVVLERPLPKATTPVGPDGDDAHRRETTWSSGSFRVEAFRVPLVDARISGPKAAAIAPAALSLDVQINYFAGGAMGQAPLRGSALLKARSPSFPAYDEYRFDPPRDPGPTGAAGAADESDESEESASAAAGRDGRLVADKVPLTTDRDGAAVFTVRELPAIVRPGEITAEVTFDDPNGETQTASTRVEVWPSALVLGIKTGAWASARGKASFGVVALDTTGRPIAGQRVTVRGRLSQTLSVRKRIVGGFYAYDNRTEVKDFGTLCSGTTDARGLLACQASLDHAGQVELIAEGSDAQGRAASAAASIWVTGRGELWFAQDNDDRIDVLPEKKRYEPGETARLQVRMPYREATALVTVEREGVIATRVQTLRGDDPTLEVKIDAAWAPNVYVSVLVLRGRIRETPWYSLFTWGWREPLAWWRSFWSDGKDVQAPTAMVDLAKPSFKLGVAALQVGRAAHELQVSVTPDKPAYQVREKVSARVRVSQQGRPMAGARVAFAAVDEGLLTLRANDSWDLLGAMLKTRPWGVETATAQGEIIGRRHYGRKAVAAGGGGGHGATRELFDTLLVWLPDVVLDAAGEATIEVPLNDSLTTFRLVAVADADVQKFGTGSASVRVSQDLQVLSGLPPLVRDGDRFNALLTLRNTTAREMKVQATLQGTASVAGAGGTVARIALPSQPQEIVLAASSAREITWPVNVPAGATDIAWEASADAGSAKDRLKLAQRVVPAVPVRVLQATLVQLDGGFTLPVAAPADALPGPGGLLGGLDLALQPRLTGALPGLRRYFETYPFSCLEQQASRSIGLKDAALWAALVQTLPTYLDSDGLAAYFPPRADEAPRGSDTLTAYLLSAAHAAGFEIPAAPREAMLGGLAAFVEGRIERRFWSPRPDLDVRKLAAIAALARHGRGEARMLGSVNPTPNVWPTSAVIDWLEILKRIDAVPERARRLAEANQILRSRLVLGGTTLTFSTEASDFWWWLMDSADANAARLILAVLDDPAWRDDLPRMVVGTLARQRRGAWLTTTANVWGSLALDRFASTFEQAPISGRSVASTGTPSAPATTARTVVDWTTNAEGGRLRLPWPTGAATLSVAQEGSGKPWLTVQGLAAIALKAPLSAGYSVARSVTPVEQKTPGRWSRGDVMRVRLQIDALSDMTWVVVSDPVPGGATLLGSGLGRDSQIAGRGEQATGRAWPAWQERGFEAFRSYYEFLPRGRHTLEYTLRLNNPGRFSLPPTRAEAMYAPESFGETPNAPLEIAP